MYDKLWHVVASFEGTCPWCDDPIEEGDPIVYLDGETIHRECCEEADYEVG